VLHFAINSVNGQQTPVPLQTLQPGSSLAITLSSLWQDYFLIVSPNTWCFQNTFLFRISF